MTDATSDAERPWALQLAARVEKTSPPPVEGIWAAAVLATVALLDDERSAPGGPWHAAVEHWNGRRIRKLVRRGRGAAWGRAQEPDGVTVERDGAEVRAFVPCPVDDPPAAVAKLQIQSSPLPEPEPVDGVEAAAGTLVVLLTPEVEMSWGKRTAQAAHAGQLAWMAADAERRGSWDEAGRPVRALAAGARLWAEVADDCAVQVHDGGFTEIPAGTRTAVAFWA